MQPLPLLPREKLFSQVKGIDEKIEKKMQRLDRFKDDFESQSKFDIFKFLDQSVKINTAKKITIPGYSLDGKCCLVMM